MRTITEEQEEMVRRSWETLRQDIPRHSTRFFTLIVEIAPAVKEMFSFLRDFDEVPQNNPDLRAHAVKVFKMTCESAIQLRENGQVKVADSKLRHLASIHLSKGVALLHFEVVKEALLRTIKEAMGERWCEEMNSAWATSFEQLAAAIKHQMKLDDECCCSDLKKASAITEEQEELVRRSWEKLRQDIPRHSIRFFTLIMEIAPEVKEMFSFLRDYDKIPQDNPDLRAHAVKVFKMTCESAIQLRENGHVEVPCGKLRHLASMHRKNGVAHFHFEVVKEALLRTIKEAVGEKWSEEMNSAWATSFHHLAAAIKKEMNLEE
ncbi:hypothetical protein L6164_006884 [Bauhinia variegata]|uniref:Uncharacterized protein n=1 Tax=Bauhinia variegata TaxID=167791 RepID=A0ACB9PVW7_BAUVA|nr:hypothetical protein L6164_006884 [Bauhinia variegata]